MSVVSCLARVPLFAGLSEEELAKVAQHVRHRRLAADEVVVRKDDPGLTLYIIQKGKVKIHSQPSEEGEVIFGVLSEGEFFGELSLIDGLERSADVTTLEETELLMLNRDDFLRCLRELPAIALNILVALCQRLRKADEWIEAFTGLDVHGRVLKALLDLSDRYGVDTDAGREIDLHLSQSDLASMVASSRESVNKVLGHYRHLRLLTIDGQRIILHNVAEIRRRLESRYR
ncbi:MAG: Crp/Fnr family transcriptional regulator [Abditibacteriales bacterium]|nr:Crp/Fnr family transcriptional regulator [Abditibacteriales bacterium]MDW8366323.1 Crp/Fnr family transcriptional regulator [Abditibacteriales bacterium]